MSLSLTHVSSPQRLHVIASSGPKALEGMALQKDVVHLKEEVGMPQADRQTEPNRTTHHSADLLEQNTRSHATSIVYSMYNSIIMNIFLNV